jgi:iron complex outermembrane receptor protein
MNFQRKKLARALGYAVGAVMLVTGASAFAQEAATPPENKIKVEVVGSSIKRSLEDESLPVQVITKEDIARSGVQNMEQLIAQISATATTGSLNGAAGAGLSTYGASFASLRGLGASRTLVLLDGQRMTPFAQEFAGAGISGNGVDINSIPISAIERVEVLTDGASSIYGSDAIAGVINFVLRRNFTGVTAGYEYDAPTESGGGKTNNFWVSGGYGDILKDKWNITGSYQYKKETALWSYDRDFAKSGNVPPFYINGATPSGRIEGTYVPGSVPSSNAATKGPNGEIPGGAVPYGISSQGYGNPGADSPGCAAMGMFDITGAPRIGTGRNCNFDSAPFLMLFPDVKTQSGVISGNAQFTPQIQGYFTGLYSQNEVTQIIQPNPARYAFFATDTAFEGSGVDQALLIYPGNPNYPHAWLQTHGLSAMDGSVLAVSSRAFAAGDRAQYTKNTQQQYVAGIKGTWLKDWDYDVNGQWSQSKSEGSVTGGYFSQVAFANVWNTVGNTPGSYVDPWSVGGAQNDTLSAALLGTNYTGPTASAEEKLSMFTAKTSGTLYELPAGPLASSFGFSYMKQSYNVDVPPILLQGDISGLGGATLPQNGDRNVTSGWIELAFPATKDINFDLSGRVDHYSDLQEDATPVTGKLSVTWQPWKWGMFRGSFGNGFRAPAMGELHNPVSLGTSEQFIDPEFADAGPVQVNSLTGGNLLLKPEKSNQASVGFVWTPVPTFTGRVDYWYIKIDNYILAPPALALVNAARAGADNGTIFAPDGEVDQVTQILENAGTARFSGLDFAADWRIASPWGTWNPVYQGTYYLKADLTPEGVSVEHNIGTLVDPQTLNPLLIPSFGGVIPRYKHNAAINWNYGPWGATLANHYITGYETAPNQEDGTTPHFVNSFSTWDIQGTYSGIKYLQLVLGLRNMFDTQPHLFIPTSNQFQYGYDPSIYDPRGRVWYGRAVLSF